MLKNPLLTELAQIVCCSHYHQEKDDVMIEVSSMEYHFWQLMVLVALGLGYVWGRENGIKKEKFDAENRRKRSKE